ncbi:MAG: 16S rRNA (uracil(1498)-N(3))-methyltransferase [Steroidobacteraceae bacterium]
MRLSRVYVDQPLADMALTVIAGPPARHVLRVLRLRRGDPLVLFNGDGWDYPGTVEEREGDRLQVTLANPRPGLPECPIVLTLVQGVARSDRMDTIIQKATELGAARVMPVLAGRSVVRLDARQAERKLAHWQAVAVAACEQSGRARPPLIDAPQPLPDALTALEAEPTRLRLEPAASRSLASIDPACGRLALLIGPEGGLAPEESRLADAAGFEARSLGPRILRTETAALAALTVVQSRCGDLQ